jgi:hypothetical protein
VLVAIVLAAHLRHSGILWEGDDLPLAAALAMKHGAVLYSGVWFDKPPLVAAVGLLWGAMAGWPLRLAGAIYALIAAGLAGAVAARLWTSREGYIAAGMMAFFLTFDTPSAVVPLAADMLLLVPHLAAVYFCVRRQPFWCGVAAGAGFLCNTKALFVLAACVVLLWPAVPLLLAGFIVPCVAGAAWLLTAGNWSAYLDQVWRWPAEYAASPVVADPIRNGVVRTANWLGFHAAIVIGTVLCWLKGGSRRWKLLVWLAIGYAGVVLGWRFFPRYYLLILPPLVTMGAAGLASIRSRALVALTAVTLAVPLIRFAPRYVSLSNWSDLALDEDSRAAAGLIQAQAVAGSSLYVWGYRPELFVYTGLRPASRYLDSQAMTGVPADRHLTQSVSVVKSSTHEAREELARSHPDFIADGLSLYNPALSMDHYAELRPWLADYREVARTKGTVIYARYNR